MLNPISENLTECIVQYSWKKKRVNNKKLTFPRPMTAVLSGTTAKEVAGVNKIATTVILKETNTESG